MWQNSANQRGNSLPSLGPQVQIDYGDQQPTATAENVSGSGRLSRGVSLPSMTGTTAIALPQQTGFLNPVSAAASVTTSVGLPISVDQGIRLYESGEASTSRQPQMVPTQYGYSFSQEVFSQIRDHSIEMATLIRNYCNTIRQAIEEKQNSYWISQVSIMEQMAMKRIMEKHAEIQNAIRRNSELEEMISKLSTNNQILFHRARQYEALALKFRADLRNVLSQKTDAAAPSPAIESCDDNGLAPFAVNDEQSCYMFEAATENSSEKVPRRLICKVCLVKEISVLILHCRHLCLCEECESKVDICPVCNSLKAGTVKIFMP